MEKQATFHDLATHLRMLLESESYSQTTVKVRCTPKQGQKIKVKS